MPEGAERAAEVDAAFAEIADIRRRTTKITAEEIVAAIRKDRSR